MSSPPDHEICPPITDPDKLLANVQYAEDIDCIIDVQCKQFADDVGNCERESMPFYYNS
jgi:hypothetical protein